MSWNEIIYNILLSITASFFFWIFTFKISFTKVIFDKRLVKADNTLTDVKKSYGYRLRFANVGFRDLIELTMVVKLVINDPTCNHICFLDISNSGQQNFMTALPSIITYKIKKLSNIRTLTIYPSDSMQHELSKKKYPPKIRKLSRKGKLQFRDIFEEYGDNVTITIYVYGNDKTTGARKMFESKHYTMHDIEEGDFYGSKEIKIPIFSRKKVKIDKLSKIHKKIQV